MAHDLSHRISELIANAYKIGGDDADYQGSFAEEGKRKAQYVIDDLAYREAQGSVRPDRLAYLCIGGADGSEVEQVLNATSIAKAVMIEISADGVARAASRVASLAQRGKKFVVLKGDATSLLDEALSTAERWLKAGEIDGLVCSAQGVLHELPNRSAGFVLPTFLGKIFRIPDWRVCAFYSREPSRPDGWPEAVLLHVPGVSQADLVRIANFVRDRLHMSGRPEALGNKWVGMPSVLAVETLHKLLRDGSIARIEYELGEQLTGFDPMAVKRHLQTLVAGMQVSVEHVTTSGFKNALRDYQVEYCGHNSEQLPVPKTHSEIIGFYCKSPAETKPLEKIDPPRASAPAAESGFHNPFDSNVSDYQITRWLAQFQPQERPLIARLLNNFTYIGFGKLRSLSVRLCSELKGRLGDTFERAWYVPVGGPAKSGGLAAYMFRTMNEIASDRFVSYADLAKHVQEGDAVVMLDDLLASGHQARMEWESICKAAGLPSACIKLWATLVSCEAGRTFIEERTELESISALRLDRKDEPLSVNSTLFPDPAERDQVRKILETYGAALAPKAPLGYAGSGLLLAFEHSTPDNSLPIFWAKTAQWTPLLTKGSPARM